MAGPYSIVLDAPPTANLIWRVGKGRSYKSHAYRSWIKDSIAQFWVQGPYSRMLEKTPLWLDVLVNIDRKSDLDNRLKPILDLLQRAKAIADDRYVDRISLARSTDIPKNKTVVRWGLIV